MSALTLPFLAVLTLSAQQPPSKVAPAPPAAGRLVLTVDNIMRGPDLVGYPPAGLRWSGDSRDLFFEWRKPGEESATYVLPRHEPRKLTDDEKRRRPSAGSGTSDRRLFGEHGDIVVLDTQSHRQR
jgi:hypothetical protein